MRKVLLLILFTCCLWCCSDEKGDSMGSIYGVVVDKATGEPVKSAGVELRPLGQKTVTGSEGQFEYTNLEPNGYTLFVTKTGYADLISSSVVVRAGEVSKTDLQIELLPPDLKVVDNERKEIDTLYFGVKDADITRSFNIFNDGVAKLEWEITYTAEWINSVSKTSGVLNPGATQALVIVLDRTKLKGGENVTALHITSNNGSKQLIINATGLEIPSVFMHDISGVDYEFVRFNGEILSKGIPEYSECGFVFAETPNPTLENTIQILSLTEKDKLFHKTSGNKLHPYKTYYARAYAVNEVGIVYSNEISFKTKTPILPQVSAVSPTNIYEIGVTLNGYVVQKGSPNVNKYGFIYSTTNTESLTIDNAVQGFFYSGTPSNNAYYSLSLTNLNKNTTYFVRSCMMTPYDTIYSSTYTFQTQLPYKIIGTLGVRLEDQPNEYGEWKMTSAEAKSSCEKLVLGNYDDWRLPTIDELKMIYEYREEIGGFKQDLYRTSTKNKDDPDFEDGPWREGYICIDFSNGKIRYDNPYGNRLCRVRAVRTLP